MPAKQYHVVLDEEQRTQLARVVNSNKRSPRERTRARILLLADAAQDGGGCPDNVICQKAHTSASTVVRVRQRFAQAGWCRRSPSDCAGVQCATRWP